MSNILSRLPSLDSEAKEVSPASQINGVEGATWVARYELLQRMNDDVGLGGEALKAMAGNPKYAEALEYWKQEGVVDAQWNVNQGQLMDKTDDFHAAVVEARTMQPMTPEQQIGFKDSYSSAVNKQIDPRLVKIEDLGDGVKRTTILNADGKTPAQSFLTGSMTLPNGQTIDNVTLTGASRRDWSKYQEGIEKTGSLFSDTLNGGANAADLPPGYKGAPLDPRTIEGYEQGLSYMGGFGGGVAPLDAENMARMEQGMQQIGPKDAWAQKPHVTQGSGLPGGLGNLPDSKEIKAMGEYVPPDAAKASWGAGAGGSGMANLATSSTGSNAFAEQLKKV